MKDAQKQLRETATRALGVAFHTFRTITHNGRRQSSHNGLRRVFPRTMLLLLRSLRLRFTLGLLGCYQAVHTVSAAVRVGAVAAHTECAVDSGDRLAYDGAGEAGRVQAATLLFVLDGACVLRVVGG